MGHPKELVPSRAGPAKPDHGRSDRFGVRFPGILPCPTNGIFEQAYRGLPFSFGELLNKPAQLYLQPANPFVVRPGQLHVALRVGQR